MIAAVQREKPDAIVLRGDIEAGRLLEVELAPILGKTQIRFNHGNHDTDTDFLVRNLFDSELPGRNLDGRVENIAGVRIAGLGGIFCSKSRMPPATPRHCSYDAWLAAVRRSRTGIGRTSLDAVLQTQMRTQRSTIFWEIYERLFDLRADVLVTHKAPSVHPYGFAAIDQLANAMGATATFHARTSVSMMGFSLEWIRTDVRDVFGCDSRKAARRRLCGGKRMRFGRASRQRSNAREEAWMVVVARPAFGSTHAHRKAGVRWQTDDVVAFLHSLSLAGRFRSSNMLCSTRTLEHCVIAASDGMIGHVKDFHFDDRDWVSRHLVVDWGNCGLVPLARDSLSQALERRQLGIHVTRASRFLAVDGKGCTGHPELTLRSWRDHARGTRPHEIDHRAMRGA